MMTHTEH